MPFADRSKAEGQPAKREGDQICRPESAAMGHEPDISDLWTRGPLIPTETKSFDVRAQPSAERQMTDCR